MKNAKIPLTLAVLAGLLTAPAWAQGPTAAAKRQNPTPQKQQSAPMTVSSSSSAQVLRQFFTAFGQGDGAAVVRLFADDATITAVRPGERQGKGLYGTYRGKEGAQQFLTNLGLAFETQAFSVDHVVGEGETAFAQGSFTHRVKATGKLFASSWALRCLVRQGHIVEYQFFEDSAAFAEAAR